MPIAECRLQIELTIGRLPTADWSIDDWSIDDWSIGDWPIDDWPIDD
ncbi:MAG TPA: hypothetical protein VD833_07250 [Vicinamibacterales bacterium]|nr:hypothetical protein [Vicinamibacterales bacterium]